MGCGSCCSKSKNEEEDEERKNGCLPCCKSEESSRKKKKKRKRSWNPLTCLTCRAKRVMCCSSSLCCCANKPSESEEKKHKSFCCGNKPKSSESKEKKWNCCCINKPSKSEGRAKPYESHPVINKPSKSEGRTKPSESYPVINKPSEFEGRIKPSESRPVITKELKKENRDNKSSEEKKKKKKSKKESKRGSRLGCLVCGCCRKPKTEDDNNRKSSDEGAKSAKSSKDANNKKAFGESKEGRKRTCLSCKGCKGKGLMGCFCCVKSENKKPPGKKKEPRRGSQLAFLVHSISFKSDGDKQRTQAEEILRIGNGNIAARVFQFRELAAATKNFKAECLLGEGGFGRVYKGKLEDSNQIVAVKQLDRNGFQGNREFLIEVLMLSLLHHQNLVKLLGYCAEGDQRILVYEYMQFGSLEDHLLAPSLNKKPLDWHTRMKIALGSAKGLEYLHDIASPPVIYRDFKASNILLDGEYNPKLSDFGLAKLGPMGDKTHVSTRVMGTYGYCAPEYALTGKLTKMSDVYSFGVVFLEIITGRRAIDISKPTNEQQLVYWAGPLFRDKSKFVEMADPSLLGKYPIKGLYQALAVASMCLQEGANIRPRISDVVTALEYLSISSDDSTSGLKESIPMEVATPILVSEMSTDGIEVVNKKENVLQTQSNSEDEICSTWIELEQGVDIT